MSIVLRFPAALCLAGSSIILFGWVTKQPGLLSIFSEGEPIPAQGALLGVLLSLAALLPVGWQWGRILLAGPAALIAVLSLAESVFGIDLGIDWRFAGAWTGPDPAAGRTVSLAAITCILVSTGLMLAPAPLGSRRRQIIGLMAAATALIALGSLSERVLDLGAIYGWHYLNRMPITTSGGMMFILLPLWWNRMPRAERDLIPRDPAATLMSSGTALLIAVSVLAGSTGLISMRRGIEDGMRSNLLATVRGLGTVFETAIDDRVKFGRLAAARSDLQAAVAAVTAAPDAGAARAILQNVTESLIGGDIRGVNVLDKDGRVIATSGRLASRPGFARIVDPVSGTRLVWDERLLIDVNTDLMQGAAKLGRIVVEQELPALDTVLVQAAGLGASGNGTICGLEPADSSRMECLPNRANPLPFNAPVRLDGRLLPIANALMGLTGTVDSFDRGGSRVIAAFEPLPRLGLAIDVKVDTAELFQPVRIRARIAVPVLIMIVIGGSLILRDRIAPLTRQLVESEREARERGEALEESRRELMHKNRVLDVALNNMAQGLVLYDGNGRLRAFNQRYERMMGFAPGFLRAGLSHAAVRKRSAEFGAASVEEGVALLLTMGGEETGRQVVERRLRDGRVIEIVHEPLEEDGGVITFSDVTAARAADDALRAAKEGAEAANRAKSEFLSMMSHEVRTPMNGVLGMIRLLLGSRLAADQHKFAETARSSAEALLAILDDILDFSKLEAGRLMLETVTLDLDAFIEGILAIMGPLARDKALVLDCERAPELPRWIETDSTRLRQIILNLLGNAVKFTEQGKVTLRLGARPAGPGQITLSVAVEDTGPGIAPEVVPSLFSRFTQADSSITRKFGGTGLGLAISKQLAELMGGSISVETVLGRGSIFRVSLPSRVAPAPAPSPATSQPAEPGRKLSILVVEDNPVNLAVVTAMLGPYEHAVETAIDGIEALARVERGGIDLVFMDIQMPRMDGLAATREIRALAGEASHVPIVALTANAMAGHREEYLAAGMNDYIAKPLRPEDLARVLERWSGLPADAPQPAPAPVPTAPAGPLPVVDTGRIAELAAIIPADGLAAMMEAFFVDSEKRLATMSAAAEAKDLDALRRAAHDMAGLAANYGLAETEQVARQTLAACRAGDTDAAWPLAGATVRAFRRAEGPLRHAVGTRLAARGTAA